MPQLQKHDPLNVPATLEQINAKHKELESSPVLVFGVSLDCDERAEMRMRNTIEHWDDLPLQDGVIEEIEGTKVVVWTMGDNSIATFNKPVLETVFAEMLKQRAIRATALFSALRQLKADPTTTLRNIQNPSAWGL